MSRELCCGAASRVITPPEDLLPDLYGLMNTRFGTVIDDLHVRVIALRNHSASFLIIAYELDKAPFPQETISAASARWNIPPENIIIASIHTHTAPVIGNRPNEPWNDKSGKPEEVRIASSRYEHLVSERTSACIEEAVSCLRPAVLSFAEGLGSLGTERNQMYECRQPDGRIIRQYDIGYLPDHQIDRRLNVIRFSQEDGSPIAILINYPLHNIAMFTNHCGTGRTAGISSDIAGSVCRTLEKEYPGSVAAWTSGAAGDINPYLSSQVMYPDPDTGAPRTIQLEGSEAPLTILALLAGRHCSEVKQVLADAHESHDVRLGGCVEWAQLQNGDGQPLRIRLHLSRIGELMILGIGGELYSSYALRLKEIYGDHLIVMNHDASMIDDCSYLIDEETQQKAKTADQVCIPGYDSVNYQAADLLLELRIHLDRMMKQMEEKDNGID